MSDHSATPPLRVVRIAAKCPICSRPAQQKYQPFCSKRCADIDLGRWLKEGYRVETDDGPGDDEPGGGSSGAGGPSGQRG